jgi:hypothetical protein
MLSVAKHPYTMYWILPHCVRQNNNIFVMLSVAKHPYTMYWILPHCVRQNDNIFVMLSVAKHPLYDELDSSSLRSSEWQRKVCCHAERSEASSCTSYWILHSASLHSERHLRDIRMAHDVSGNMQFLGQIMSHWHYEFNISLFYKIIKFDFEFINGASEKQFLLDVFVTSLLRCWK